MTPFQLINVSVSVALFTLIWIIQILHYPFFQFLNKESCSQSMMFHQRRISYIVIPLMLTEVVVTGYALVTGRPGSLATAFIIVLIWGATFYYQVPLHRKLTERLERVSIDSLVKMNWIRTILWTIKLIIVLFFTLNP